MPLFLQGYLLNSTESSDFWYGELNKTKTEEKENRAFEVAFIMLWKIVIHILRISVFCLFLLDLLTSTWAWFKKKNPSKHHVVINFPSLVGS